MIVSLNCHEQWQRDKEPPEDNLSDICDEKTQPKGRNRSEERCARIEDEGNATEERNQKRENWIPTISTVGLRGFY